MRIKTWKRGSGGVGLAVRREAGKQKELGSILHRLTVHFKSCDLLILSHDFASQI